MIGSARKVGLVRTRFLERGWCTAAEWARVHTAHRSAHRLEDRGRDRGQHRRRARPSAERLGGRMIWAVLLAAGESKRMGTPKQLLPFGRTTVIETALEHILASRVGPDPRRPRRRPRSPRPLLERFPVSLTVNPDFREGMLSSVRWGIRHLPPDARAALIFLGDQPWITSETIDRVIHAYKTSGLGLVLPVHGKTGRASSSRRSQVQEGDRET